jgi:hypothetical protein
VTHSHRCPTRPGGVRPHAPTAVARGTPGRTVEPLTMAVAELGVPIIAGGIAGMALGRLLLGT